MTDDPTIYDELIAPLESKMMRSIWRVLRRPDLAEDALQDALAVIWKKRQAILRHPNPQALVLRICIDVAHDSLRKAARSGRRVEISALSDMPSAPGNAWAAANWTVYWPAVLIVWGGALALMLSAGDAPAGPSPLACFVLAGLIGSLMGFIQTILALGAKSIEDVASAVTFVLSSCVAALLGMILAGAPLEDRSARCCGGGGARTVGRLASAIFPLVALIFLIVIFVLVVTPIEIEVGGAKP